jgi:hypothetical protein
MSTKASRARGPLAAELVDYLCDTSVGTVNRHYFRMDPELMRELVLGWKRPDVDIPAIAAVDLGAAERICDIEPAS